jgi:acetyltransferase-like isoleucine patch superfamily enzyme
MKLSTLLSNFGQAGADRALEGTHQGFWRTVGSRILSRVAWTNNEQSATEVDLVFFEDPISSVVRVINKIHSLWLSWTYPFASVGSRFSVHYSCDLRRSVAAHMKVGNRVRLHRGVSLDISGVPENNEPVIVLEDGCGITRNSIISAKNRISIARGTMLGPNALITDHDDADVGIADPSGHSGITDRGTIRIEEGCWIGRGAAVISSQGELVIGRNSVVAANSVVRQSIPPYSVVTGNPAKVVKQFDLSTRKWVLGSGRSTVRG